MPNAPEGIVRHLGPIRKQLSFRAKIGRMGLQSGIKRHGNAKANANAGCKPQAGTFSALAQPPIRYTRQAFSQVTRAMSSSGSSRSAAIFFSTHTTLAGSLRLPRRGSGDR